MSYLLSDLITRISSRICLINSCWIWTGAISKNGYGNFRNKGVHRVVYSLFKGEIPKGYQVDHLCRNKLCVNPEHLEAVTAWENNKRSQSPSAKNISKTHCKRGHEFTKENTTIWRNKRLCRTCRRETALTHYYRSKLNVVSG